MKVKKRKSSQKSPKVDTKKKTTEDKQNVFPNQRLCNRCKIHAIVSQFKGHKCQYIGCECIKCKDYNEKNRRRHEKRSKETVTTTATNQTSKTDTNSFVKSLKAKSTKLLNKKKSTNNMSKTKGTKTTDNKHTDSIEIIVEENEEIPTNGANDPPKLLPEAPILQVLPLDICHSSTTQADTNGNTGNENYPVKTNAGLCAQYMKGCEELSRKIAFHKLTDDEMIACYKYSIIRDCLGDIDMAAQKIICASEEIRSGAAHMIQHPNDDRSDRNSMNSRQNQLTVTNSPLQLPLCSTFNVNYQPNTAVNYCPAFTPIRNNS